MNICRCGEWKKQKKKELRREEKGGSVGIEGILNVGLSQTDRWTWRGGRNLSPGVSKNKKFSLAAVESFKRKKRKVLRERGKKTSNLNWEERKERKKGGGGVTHMQRDSTTTSAVQSNSDNRAKCGPMLSELTEGPLLIIPTNYLIDLGNLPICHLTEFHCTSTQSSLSLPSSLPSFLFLPPSLPPSPSLTRSLTPHPPTLLAGWPRLWLHSLEIRE